MKRQDLLIWAAGLHEGCGAISISPQEGPSKTYMSITINYPVGGEGQVQRLLAVNNNGSMTQFGFEISGWAAVRGYFSEIWPYLSAEGRSQINEALRFYKEKKKWLRDQPASTPEAKK